MLACKNNVNVIMIQTSNHLLGPKPFPLDRLLAIFYSVVDSRVAPTASIFSQVRVLKNCLDWNYDIFAFC